MHLQVEAFLTSLGLMVEGMLGIFAVMLVIMGLILLLNRLMAEKKNP